MKKILEVAVFLCITLLFTVSACKAEVITTTVNITSTVTKAAPTITQTLPVSTTISTVMSTVTNIKTVTVTPVSTTTIKTSSTSTQMGKTVVTTLTEPVFSSNGMLQILEATLLNINTGPHPSVTGTIVNNYAGMLNAKVTVKIMSSNEVLETTTIDVLKILMASRKTFVIESLLNTPDPRITGFDISIEVIP